MSTPTASSKLQRRVVPFAARDGFECNLIHVRGEHAPTKAPVLLVHGAGVRANIFEAPVETTLVDYLVARGYDVWLENWRASIEFPPNRWNLDDAALNDHPAAVETVVRETGAEKIKAVIHCQGSTSFTMSAIAGLVPQVSTIVSNAVSLHTVLPAVSKMKILYTLPFLRAMTDYLNPQWGRHAPTFPAKLVSLLVSLVHHECDNPVCKQVSFTYGSGFPALWSHENLNDATHEWLSDEFAEVPMRFFTQMAKCVRKGNLVSMGGNNLPADLAAKPPQTDARFAFFTGQHNLCFLPASQVRSYDWFDSHRRGYHSLYELPSYGHLDVFMGKNAARDVFPLIEAELDKKN
jgi:hypothetical protein